MVWPAMVPVVGAFEGIPIRHSPHSRFRFGLLRDQGDRSGVRSCSLVNVRKLKPKLTLWFCRRFNITFQPEIRPDSHLAQILFHTT